MSLGLEPGDLRRALIRGGVAGALALAWAALLFGLFPGLAAAAALGGTQAVVGLVDAGLTRRRARGRSALLGWLGLAIGLTLAVVQARYTEALQQHGPEAAFHVAVHGELPQAAGQGGRVGPVSVHFLGLLFLLLALPAGPASWSRVEDRQAGRRWLGWPAQVQHLWPSLTAAALVVGLFLVVGPRSEQALLAALWVGLLFWLATGAARLLLDASDWLDEETRGAPLPD